MDVPAYLRRIGYTGPIAPTAETLRLLHRAHLETVPFENLDISQGRKITVDESSSIRKIVEERRGGFCYELNGAFAALLRALDFTVTLLSAKVVRADGSLGREFDHLTLLVDLDEPWLADIGFGDCFIEPLRLESGIEQKQDNGIFRIEEKSGSLTVESQADGNWNKVYLFTLTPRRLEDFAAMCHYQQTSPESHFTQKRVCTLLTPNGRITLSDLKLIVTENGNRHESILSSEEEWKQVLAERFGVVIRNAAP